MNNIIALVPLRGGSKSIPNKNIKPIAGKPLCVWSLEAAYESRIFNQIIVSTDSYEISQVVSKLNMNFDVMMRPLNLATDATTTEAVMLHIAEQINFDILFTIQVTSPLVRSLDFRLAYEKFVNNNLDSLLTGVRVKRFYWSLDGNPINYDPLNRPMRQDFDGVIMENGAFYITKRNILEKYRCRLGGRIGIYEMSKENAVEIDEPDDWNDVEHLILKNKQNEYHNKVNKLALLVVDVDGTLTDGGMYYSAEGDILKKFNTRDARGLELIRNKGIKIAILTSEKSNIVKARAEKLGIDMCYLGVADKKQIIENLCCELSISYKEVGFIGDDLNDLEVMKVVGFSACPSDAVSEIKQNAFYVSSYRGGQGAVRDVCDFIIQSTIS